MTKKKFFEEWQQIAIAEMRDIKDALAAALPLGHPDRLKLERSTGKAKTTQINHLSKLIKGVKGRGNKVYGFVFEPLTKE
jgi:hypothetical protein